MVSLFRKNHKCYTVTKERVIYYDNSCPAESLLSMEGCFIPKFFTFENADTYFTDYTDHIKSGSCYRFWKRKFMELDPSIMFSIKISEFCTPELSGSSDNELDESDSDGSKKMKSCYRPELTRSFKKIPINDETLDHTQVYDNYPWEDYMRKNKTLSEKMIVDFERKFNRRELLPLDYRTHLLRHGPLEQCWANVSRQLKMYIGNPKAFATHPVELDENVLGDLSPAHLKLSDCCRESGGRTETRPGVIYLMSGGCTVSLFMVIRGSLKGYIFADNDGLTWFVCSNFRVFMEVMYQRVVDKLRWMIEFKNEKIQTVTC